MEYSKTNTILSKKMKLNISCLYFFVKFKNFGCESQEQPKSWNEHRAYTRTSHTIPFKWFISL